MSLILAIRSEHLSTYNVLGGEILEGATLSQGHPISKTLKETAGLVRVHRVLSFFTGATDSAVPPMDPGHATSRWIPYHCP